MKIVSFDLGTKCGVAEYDDSRSSLIGYTLDLSGGRFEGGGMRYLRFREHVNRVIAGAGTVLFEEVRGHKGTDAAHVYGGLMAMLVSECEMAGIPYVGIPVGSAKKAATGKGNAGKPAVREALECILVKMHGDHDDNVVDAIAVILAHLDISVEAFAQRIG